MSIEIKTSKVEPIRQTFEHIKRRFGEKPATRYQEASYDLQATDNFHYKPLWEPDKELNDTSRTALLMEDWYAFKDPRQFYYGTYVQARAKLQENTEHNYSFFEKRGLGERLPLEVKQAVVQYMLPLRHVELGANLNNVYGTAYGYGTVLTQALLFNSMDRLGIAQYLSRIGLMLDGNSGDSLAEAKKLWMEDPTWQGVRRYVEKMLVTKDWFKLFLAQDVVLDTLLFNLTYVQLDARLAEMGGADIAVLTDFMQEWNKDNTRWVDSVLKIAAAESEENKALMTRWLSEWTERAVTDLGPLAAGMAGDDALNTAREALEKRLLKAKLSL